MRGHPVARHPVARCSRTGYATGVATGGRDPVAWCSRTGYATGVATGGRDPVAWQAMALAGGHADALERVRTGPSRTRCCETHDRLVCSGQSGAAERPPVGRRAALRKVARVDGTAVAVGRVCALGTRNRPQAEASVRRRTKNLSADIGLVMRGRRLRLAGLRPRRLALKD